LQHDALVEAGVKPKNLYEDAPRASATTDRDDGFLVLGEVLGDVRVEWLLLQELHRQIALRPLAAGDVPEPGRSQVQRRLAVGECPHDPRAPADLAQNALERIVRPDPSPVLPREGVVAECLFDPRLDELGGFGQPQVAQLQTL
jgi:hypothetical protein